MIKGFAALAAAMVMVTAGPAVAADQFDLVCKGTEQEKLNGRKAPYEVRYRIDLTAKRWCSGVCDSARAIQSVTPDLITIRSNFEEPGRQDVNTNHTISRVDGRLTDHFSTPGAFGVWIVREGACEPAPFSGFPTTKF